MRVLQQPYRLRLSLLATSVAAVLIAGCSTTPAVQSQPPQSMPSTASVQSESNVSTAPAKDSAYTQTQALLDDESLNDLEKLLEASNMAMVEDDRLAIQRMGNLWDRMRKGFKLDSGQYRNHPRILAQKNWFVTRQDYLNRLTARASRYLYHTVREAERRGIPTELALLPVIESSYDPTATSNAQAAGLWQFIPSTGTSYGLTQTRTYDGRRDIIDSTNAAYDFLTTLYNRFGSWELALAAYNTGPGNVQKAIDANAARGLPTDFWSLNLAAETMNYVPRLLAVAQVVRDTQAHGIYLPAIANREHFRTVPVQSGVTLEAVSGITGVDVYELQVLNSALLAGQVDPAGNQRVVIPNTVGNHLDQTLSQLTSAGYVASTDDNNYAQVLKSPQDLADFASTAGTPIPAPVRSNTPSSAALPNTATAASPLPSTAANSASPTSLQESPIRPEEKAYIRRVVLEDMQTEQAILQARGEERQLTYQAAAAPKPQGKRTIYTVQRGDTLINIATRGGVNWRDIAKWNQIDPNDTLLAGSKLYLYGAKDIKPLTTAAPATTTDRQPTRYTVRPGDTLIGTAVKFGLSPSKLASYNGLKPTDDLRINQTLSLVPSKTTNATNTRANTSSTTARVNYDGPTTSYRVRPGDSLTALARRYRVSVATLAGMNNLSATENLLVNQRLQVPKSTASNNSSTATAPTANNVGQTTTYTVQSGDSLIGIARKLDISHDQIASLNGLSSSAGLQRGQRIKLPVSSDKVDLALNNESIRHQIRSGDTLIGVASRYGVSLSQLAVANQMATNAQLIKGRSLIIPAGNDGSASSSSKTSSTAGGDDANFTGTYRVKSGDTLIGLANRYGVSVTDFARANALATTDGLIINQVLKVPKQNEASTAGRRSTRTPSAAQNSGSTYVVKSGDGLINLAKRNGMSVATLAAANDLSPTANLIIGQKLTIPATTTKYRVRSGDSLIGLARKYGVSTQELADLNGLSSNARLQRGQTLNVPTQ